MSGGNYGLIFLYIGIAIVGSVIVLLAGMWWWLGSLWLAVGWSSGIGLLIVAALSAFINLHRSFKNTIHGFFLGSVIFFALLGGTTGVFWVAAEGGLIASGILLINIFTFHWLLKDTGRTIMWWWVFIAGWLVMILLGEYWLGLPMLALIISLHILIHKSILGYLVLVKNPSIYFWINRQLNANGWRKLLNYRRGLKLDFTNVYIEKKINCVYDPNSIEAGMESVFWEELEKGELKLGEVEQINDQYRMHLLCLDADFILRWVALSQKSAIVRKDLEQFGSHCQDLVSGFINDASSFDSSPFLKEGIEAHIDSLLEKIPEDLEALRTALGFFYPAIGIARNIDPDLPHY